MNGLDISNRSYSVSKLTLDSTAHSKVTGVLACTVVLAAVTVCGCISLGLPASPFGRAGFILLHD
jgi:hypothetical protein